MLASRAVVTGGLIGLAMGSASAFASIPAAQQLSLIRQRVNRLEQELVDGAHASDEAKNNLRKIRVLLKLQKQERVLGLKRQKELESTVQELQARKALLDQNILAQQDKIRGELAAVEKSVHWDTLQDPSREKWDAPRRKVLAALVDRGVKEVEALKIDLEDADQLEDKISEERQQLAYMLHDLDEQNSVLELNRQLQIDMLKKHHQERLAQLENYNKLKTAESQVEDLIHSFNARVELEKQMETEREVNKKAFEQKLMAESAFNRLKGRLHLPVPGGKILTRYGRAFDSRSGLYIFKKGIEIESDKKQAVDAIYSGKVAFSGELPDYGRVTIIDHGNHFYSLCAHLGALFKKAGDKVSSGEPIGETDDSGTPVYFEIRARNVAVNPLQWVSN